MKRPISLPHPQFQTARQVIGSLCWNTLECLLHGGLPASSSSAQWISLKTTSERFFRRAGQAWIWNSKWNVFFSILAASPLSLSLKNMNRKILSLLFLLYNKRDLQYGRPPLRHHRRCLGCSRRSGLSESLSERQGIKLQQRGVTLTVVVTS